MTIIADVVLSDILTLLDDLDVVSHHFIDRDYHHCDSGTFCQAKSFDSGTLAKLTLSSLDCW